ncbi:MAG: ATP-binding cassette domain-containing protein [Candidatus Dadabacteria bacterium]|nr:MAG: ATP-binding cassette domain-containing protein [Candidatus Dadabacteria bacterium]
MPTEAVIRARGLSVGYEGVAVLRDVTFEVRPREIFAILGGSGSGKTTLLKTLIGILPPLAGTLEIAGVDMGTATEAERREALRRLGVLFQTGALLADLTLAENVMLPIRGHTGLPEVTARILACLKLSEVGLGDAADRFPNEISGGMRKRAGVARAMALDPPILVLDEPSSGLDPVTAAELDELVLGLRDNLGITVLMVTHDLESAFRAADRCILIDAETAGIRAEGDPRRLRDDPPDPKVRAFFRREPAQPGSRGVPPG